MCHEPHGEGELDELTGPVLLIWPMPTSVLEAESTIGLNGSSQKILVPVRCIHGERRDRQKGYTDKAYPYVGGEPGMNKGRHE